jgi:hypothetical protein
MPPSADEYRAGLRLLQQQQRAQLLARIEQVDGVLARDWQRSMRDAAPLYRPLIDAYARDLAALRKEVDDPAATLSLDWLTSRNSQLRTIEQSVRASLDKYGRTSAQTVTQAQAAAAERGAADAAQLTQRSLWPAVEGAGVPPSMLFNRPNPDAIAQWVGRAGNGHPLGDLFANFGAEATQQARKEMLLGLSMGANPRAMAGGIANALGISRSRATIISRTEVLGSYRSAAHETYRANSDVISGWIWSAGGANPCAMCMGMDGLQFSLEEELVDHPCGKCAPIPITRSWDDILDPLGIDSSDMLETSMGAKGAYETGEERFARMSSQQQRAILGTQTGYDAYKRGEVTLRDFIGKRPAENGFPASYYQKSLKELQIPTRQAQRLVEPSPMIQEGLRAGTLRYHDLGKITPEDQMPVWAKQSEASRNVYQILRNGLPYDMMAHEQGLLITNLEQMLREELPVNVRAAVERQLQMLGQQVERLTTAGTKLNDLGTLSGARQEVRDAQKALRLAEDAVRSDYSRSPQGLLSSALENDGRVLRAQARLEAAQARVAELRQIERQTVGAAARETEQVAIREAPFGTVDDIIAREVAQERLYEGVPMGDPQTIEKENPAAAALGGEHMQQMLGNLATELKDNGAFMRLARNFGYNQDSIDASLTSWANAKRYIESGETYLAKYPADQAEMERLAAMTRAEAQAWAKDNALQNSIYDMLDQFHSLPAAASEDITTWNADPFQIAIFEAARTEFGLGNLVHDYYTADDVAKMMDVYGTYRNGIRALVRQMYTDTQKYFEQQGITELRVFRGLRWIEGKQPEGVDWGEGMTTNPLLAQSVSSWASNAQIAYDYATGTGKIFAQEEGDYGMVLAATVPANQIMSMSYTGLGSEPLREIMVLAGDYPVYAVPFTQEEAPGLDVVYRMMAEGAKK